METLDDAWQEQMVRRESLAVKEVLIDLQFFMELCELFPICRYPKRLFVYTAVDTVE